MRKEIVLAAFTLTATSGSTFTLPVAHAGRCVEITNTDSLTQVAEAVGEAWVILPHTSSAFVSRGVDGWKYAGRECPK